MPSGHRWTLTTKRINKTLRMLRQGYTVRSISLDFDIDEETLFKRLIEHGIDAKAVRSQGIHTMRSMAYVDAMDGTFDNKMKYLDKYDKEDEIPDTPVVVNIGAIRDDLLSELKDD